MREVQAGKPVILYFGIRLGMIARSYRSEVLGMRMRTQPSLLTASIRSLRMVVKEQMI